MFRPLKKLETAWNSRTPDYLHHGTKQNIIWQLKITAGMLAAMWIYDWYETWRNKRNYKQFDGETITD